MIKAPARAPSRNSSMSGEACRLTASIVDTRNNRSEARAFYQQANNACSLKLLPPLRAVAARHIMHYCLPTPSPCSRKTDIRIFIAELEISARAGVSKALSFESRALGFRLLNTRVASANASASNKNVGGPHAFQKSFIQYRRMHGHGRLAV